MNNINESNPSSPYVKIYFKTSDSGTVRSLGYRVTLEKEGEKSYIEVAPNQVESVMLELLEEKVISSPT